MDRPYTIEWLADGTYDVHCPSGDVVQEDMQCQAFLDFLTWASHQPDSPHPGLQIPARSHFFCEPGRLIEHLKATGQLLHTLRPTPQSQRCVSRGTVRHIRDGQKPLVNMLKAAQNARDAEYEAIAPDALGIERSGFTGTHSNVYITEPLIEQLNRRMQDDKDDARRVSSWPIERCFVYLDISDFSKQLPGQQVLIINSIVAVAQNRAHWTVESWPEVLASRDSIEAMMCIGDGYIFVLDNPQRTVIFAAALAYLIEVLNAHKITDVTYHFRMSAHIGSVYSFWDPGRSGWNYIGEGINGGQRVLGAIGKDTDNVLFISGEMRQRLISTSDPSGHLPPLLDSLQNRGRRADKHGNHWRVYELNHMGLMVPVFQKMTANLKNTQDT